MSEANPAFDEFVRLVDLHVTPRMTTGLGYNRLLALAGEKGANAVLLTAVDPRRERALLRRFSVSRVRSRPAGAVVVFSVGYEADGPEVAERLVPRRPVHR